jgi:replication factor A1
MEDHNHWLASHIEDVTQMLDGKVEYDIGEVLTEMTEKAIVLKMPVEDVKSDIIDRYFDEHMTNHAPLRHLSELSTKERNVKLICKITSVNPKEVKVKGETKQIFYGLLADQTGTLPFTAWHDFGLAKGDVVQIMNAYTTEWQNDPQINLGDKSKVMKSSEDIEVSWKPLNDSIAKNNGSCKSYKVIDFQDGLSNIAVEVRVLSIETREVNVKGTKKTIFNGMIADGSGKSRFTAWADIGLHQNDAVKMSGGYIKSWRGLPDFQVDERTVIEKLDDESLPPLAELEVDRELSISEVTKLGGSTGAAVDGIVLDIKKGSGLIYRCPECKRVLQKNMCMVHGKQDGVVDLRVKATLDDGTGTMSVVIDKNGTEKIVGKSVQECEAVVFKTRNFELINDELFKALIAQPVRVHGNVITDDYGLMMICNDVELVKIDVKTEAAKLLDSIASESEGGYSYASHT